jgi:hypothetical protein
MNLPQSCDSRSKESYAASRTVFGHMPGTELPACKGKGTMQDSAGVDSVPVSQYTLHAEWVILGTFPFDGNHDAGVRLSDLGEKPWYTGCDAIRWIPQEPDA